MLIKKQPLRAAFLVLALPNTSHLSPPSIQMNGSFIFLILRVFTLWSRKLEARTNN